jgi:hypothetical protein
MSTLRSWPHRRRGMESRLAIRASTRVPEPEFVAGRLESLTRHAEGEIFRTGGG